MSVVPPFPPAAVVFDLDGVLVDSEGLWGIAERQVVEELGHPWDPAVRTAMFGRGPLQAARVLADHLGRSDVAHIDALLLEAELAQFEQGVNARPGARELVAAVQGRVPLAVSTNSRRVLAEAALASAGYEGCFLAVVCADDVAAPKPAPDAYRLACERLGVDPARTVAIEDSPVGAASARAAGLWVVGCPSFADVAIPAANAIVPSLGEVDPALLLRSAA